WMQNVALSWLIYRMTKSPAVLGQLDCANLLPMLVFGLAGGSLADTFNRKYVVLIAQTLAMMQAIVLATLTLTHRLEIWHAYVLATVLGTVSAFEVPSRQAFIVQVVGKKDLVNAISLNSSLFNGARAVGPAVAAAVVMFAGEGVCFVINAISFLAAIIAIASIRVESHRKGQENHEPVFVKDALKFVWCEPSVRRVVFLSITLGVFGLPYSVLLPVFASEVLHGDVRTLGALRAAAGLGAFLGALVLASRASGPSLRRTVGIAGTAVGVALLAFSFSREFWLSEVLVFLVGFCMTTQLSGGHSLLQLAVSDRLRGRVMSIYMMVVLGIAPLGSLMIGYAASVWGAPLTVACSACLCFVFGTLYQLSLRSLKQP
ncbi:MAG: MFS transporter, partial [Terriglobales bacterium]